MFDDYVEHSGSAGLPATGRHLPQLQFEGFESSPYDNDLLDGSTQLTDVAAQPDEDPIFLLTNVQHTLPAPLVSLSVASNVLTMALKSSTLQQLNLKNDDGSIANLTLGKKGDFSIYKIFTDPTGRHTLITTLQGENFYLFEGWQKARPLQKLKTPIECVAWNPIASSLSPASAASRTSTREILFGDRNGGIFETLLDSQSDILRTPDRYLQSIYSLPDRQAVTGIHVEPVPGSGRIVILVTSTTRLYQFSGMVDRRLDEVGKLYEPVFIPYREAAPKFLELPGTSTQSELHIASSPTSKNIRTMAWLTAQGIYHGTLNLTLNAVDIVESASLLPYPYASASPSSPSISPTSSSMPNTPNPIPLSIAITDFHFLLLYHDRICAVSSLDNKLVYEEFLGLRASEKPIAIAADPVVKTYWVYTNTSLLEVRVEREDRDVWRVHLQRGAFDQALKFAKTPIQRALINASLADEQFKAGKYIQAAQNYSQSTRGFEEVALAFYDANEPDALRYFLVARLERLPKQMLSQRMMLATWLVEFYLGKLNNLDDVVASESASQDVDNLRAERSMIEDELKSFLETYKANLHRKSVYDLILNHGRSDIYLHYASVVGDIDRVLEHYVMNEEWLKAVDQLNRQSDLELYYRFSFVLMRNAPKETVDSWLRQPSLDPHRLIPALLQTQHTPQSPLQPNHAVRYLQHVVFATGSTSPMIHNLLLTFLASAPSTFKGKGSPSSVYSKLPVLAALTAAPSSPTSSDPTTDIDPSEFPLRKFLDTAPTDPITSRPYYDLDYALRLCKRHNRLQACVHIYAQMGMWEESVELALEMGELELAKINADRPEDDEILKKKLWLMVAKYVVQDKKDIKTAMRFLEGTSVLKIEDILPFFPDFVVIDDFKDEICTALEGYSAKIDSLKNEMADATRTAEMIKQDMAALQDRFFTIEPNDKCAHCELPLLTRQFYAFPCQHSFHADCLIGQVKEYLPTTALRQIVHLQNELLRLTNTPTAKKPHSRGASTIMAAPTIQIPVNGDETPTLAQAQAQGAGALAVNIGNNLVKAAVAPAVVGGKMFAAAGAAGAGLRDLIIPESLATAITSNIKLNNIVPWGGSGDHGTSSTLDDLRAAERMKERAEKVKEELDELLASGCPLCESLVVGLDKPFMTAVDADRSWDL